MVRLPEGFSIGHWHDQEALTGCTVILCPPRTVGGCDVRGNSPGSRELALLGSEKRMEEVHALLLTGGSAFGLAAADGVMRYLEEHGTGYVTPWARVPIVPAAVMFDLNVGSSTVRPTAESGYVASRTAVPGDMRRGSVGAGIGATVGKWAGIELRMRGGLGIASIAIDELVVAAVAVVNAVGDVIDEFGSVLAGARTKDGRWVASDGALGRAMHPPRDPLEMTNTTLVAVFANARMNKVDVNRVAQRGHDGLARAIKPVHTMSDGDIVFALASGGLNVPVDLVAEAGADAAATAIRDAVRQAEPHPTILALKSCPAK
jgi:L-aminopeptidase/D-esterase-like protein